jgi:hypothetical protein
MAVSKQQKRGRYESVGIAESYNAYKTLEILSSETVIYIMLIGF